MNTFGLLFTVRRLQNRREYFVFSQQSRSRLDGIVFLARPGHFKSHQIGNFNVLSVVGSFNLQRTARSCLSVS